MLLEHLARARLQATLKYGPNSEVAASLASAEEDTIK